MSIKHYTHSQTITEANRFMALSFKHGQIEAEYGSLVKTSLSERFAKVAAEWFALAEVAKSADAAIIRINSSGSPVLV